jgi:tRNA modification GTPase
VRGRFDDARGLQPVMMLWMRGPRSFTREDVAEFHLCGSEPLLASALARLLALGATAARPGEFMLRALRNGRVDLSRVEGVLALTEAANESERAAAARLLDGGLDRRVAGIRALLLECAALCEASLDFEEVETGHVPRVELLAHWRAADAALAEALAWEAQAAAPSALPRVLLLGAPNAGKSSLWNALTGGRALVSPHAGTTRDALEGTWKLGARACCLIDGPGIAPAASGAEAKAQALFERRRAEADLVLWVVDATRPMPLTAREAAGLPRLRLQVWNKIDRAEAGPCPAPAEPTQEPPLAVSAWSGAGLRALARAVERLLGAGSMHAEPVDARALFVRHHAALARARAAVEEAGELLTAGAPLDLTAEALRGGLAALDELSGRTTPEDLLARIFARFCLGK